MNMSRDDKVQALAESIWDKANQLDYDPLHPLFIHFDDPIKDEIIALSEKLISKDA